MKIKKQRHKKVCNEYYKHCLELSQIENKINQPEKNKLADSLSK